MKTLARNAASRWKTALLGEIADVKLGKMLDKKKHRAGRALPYLRNVNVRWGCVETGDLLEMHFEDDELDRFGLRAGDVLVCEGGEPGRAAVWDGRLPDLKYQKALHRVRFREPYDPRLLVYVLELVAKTGGLERRFTGSTIKHFTREAFVQLPVPVPQIDEQRRIVAEIEKQFTRLDAGVAALRRVRANLKRYRAAVLKAACEGRLVPTEAELAREQGRRLETGEQLLARILTERRTNWSGRGKYKEPAPPSTAELATLPDGWTWTTVDQVTAGDRIAAYGVLVPGPDVEDGVPFVRVGDIRDGAVRMSDLKRIAQAVADKFAKTYLRGGEVLLTLVGTIGRSAVAPSELSGANVARAVGVIPVTKHSDARWISSWFQGPAQQHRLVGAAHEVARKTLNLEDVRSFPIALPPFAEQHRIVAELERHLSIVDELEAVVAADAQRATRLRQSILQRAFSGELV